VNPWAALMMGALILFAFVSGIQVAQDGLCASVRNDVLTEYGQEQCK